MRASSRTPRNRGRKAALFEATICSLLRRGLESLKPHIFCIITGLFASSNPQTALGAIPRGAFLT